MSDTVEMASAAEVSSQKTERPLWLSVLRWSVWLAMLVAVIAFVSRHGGGAFIYQNF
ncbi:MAG TPA: hypothetical protein VEJ63_12810 [Planctomycetota bacterium]|nr:hypothetical protein [Planctomycetota bacterium]